MIEEQFVSFDTAKMLKEAGFDVPTSFAHLINKVSRKDVWSGNPYVFVYDFELIK